jgi:hypothetical protein
MAGTMHNAVAFGASLGATQVAKKIADVTWKASAGKEPPADPTDPEVELREALVWAIVSGLLVSTLRVLVARRLSRKDRRQAVVSGAVKS